MTCLVMKENQLIYLPKDVTEGFAERLGIPFDLVTEWYVKSMLLNRKWDAHKGTYGHALLVCGSRGMTGAAVLATGAALRSGCGMVTAHVPAEERMAVVTNWPSALLSLDSGNAFSQLPEDISKYTSVGVGCGLGQSEETVAAFGKLMDVCSDNKIPMVIDADALNILASRPELHSHIPQNSVLTPHVGELKRMVGPWKDEDDKLRLAYELAVGLNATVVVKGPETAVCARGYKFTFNSTGNSGMAKGGSGDVLTGLIAGLISRGYSPENAAVLGVYLHGSAGDKAAEYFGPEAMNSADIIDFIPEAFKDLE